MSAGGLAGSAGGSSINNAYATGSVKGTTSVGGLVGDSRSSSINNAYAMGSVTGTGSVGGLVGYNNTSTMSNSFWNTQTQTNGITATVGNNLGTVTNSTGKTTAEMQQMATFSGAGWSIANTGGSSAIWRIYEGNTAPFLRSFLTGITGSKAYDGTTSTTVANYINTTIGASITPTAELKGTAVTAAAKNAGTYAITGLYSTQQGYDVLDTLTINKANYTQITGSKTYDGNFTFTGTNAATVTGVNGETFAVDTADASDKNVATANKTFTTSGALTGNLGALSTNYNGFTLASLTGVNNVATIGKAALVVTANAVTKTYDGTTSATGIGTVGSIAGAGDLVLSTGIQTYLNKNVGIANKTVSASGVTIKDATNTDVTGNYLITYIDNTVSTITAAALNVSVTANTVTKTYDGTTTATGTGTVGTIVGVGDSVLSAGIQAFLDKNVGIGNKTVRASGVTIQDLSNTDVTGNYIISYTDNFTSTINKAALTVTAGNVTKTYDGTSTATGAGTVGTLAGMGDTVLNTGIQAFLDKNVGIGNKTVRASGVTIKDATNTDVTGNYTITYTDNLTSTINKAALSITANADSKLYDGLAYAGGNGVSYAGFVNGEGLSVLAGALAYGGNSQGAIQAGTYSIIPEGLSSANYAISYLNDKLVITQSLENPIVPVITKQPIRDTDNLEEQRVTLQVATIFAEGKNENEAVNVAYKETRNPPKLKARIEIENGGIRLPR